MASGQIWTTVFYNYFYAEANITEDELPQICIVWDSEWTGGKAHRVTYKLIAYNRCSYRLRFDTEKPGFGTWCYNWVEPHSYKVLDLEGEGDGIDYGVYEVTAYAESDDQGICNYMYQSLYSYVRLWIDTQSNASTCLITASFGGVQLDKPGDYHIYISTSDGINCWTSTGVIAYIDDPFSVHCYITADYWGDYDISITGATLLDSGLFEPFQDVYITVTGVYKKYKLTIENPEGVSIIAEDLNTLEVYTNGDMVQHFTGLDVYCIVDDRYSLEELRIDSDLCAEHTYYQVLSEVTLSAKSSCPGAVWINTNGTPMAYYPYIYDGSSWNRYVPYIYDASSDAWIGCK